MFFNIIAGLDSYHILMLHLWGENLCWQHDLRFKIEQNIGDVCSTMYYTNSLKFTKVIKTEQ